MAKIEQFTEEYIKKESKDRELLFKDFLNSKEPYTSIFKNNPWLLPPDFRKPLDLNKGRYWNTTVAVSYTHLTLPTILLV